MDEIDRIRLAYEQRDVDPSYQARYTYTNPVNLFSIQQQERALLLTLGRLGIDKLTDQRILDVGCGTGGWLRNYLRYGARADNLAGIDLMPQRIEQARTQLPDEVKLFVQDAQTLPFANNSFDLISQWVVFSSILSSQVKHKVAREMLRCLAPGGSVLWCDMARTPAPISFYAWLNRQAKRSLHFFKDPTIYWQKHIMQNMLQPISSVDSSHSILAVKAIPIAEIKSLFPQCRFRHQYIIPWFETNEPIVRRSWFLAEALAASRIFNFWTLTVIQKEV
jgi:ubiquinone/menaquinone biosynthesis C-methylase UbiE